MVIDLSTIIAFSCSGSGVCMGPGWNREYCPHLLTAISPWDAPTRMYRGRGCASHHHKKGIPRCLVTDLEYTDSFTQELLKETP